MVVREIVQADHYPLHTWVPDGGKIGLITEKHPNAKRSNQDAAAVLVLDEHRMVLVVADGVGGSRSGDIAAKIAVQSIADNMNPKYELRSCVLDGFEAANANIQALGVGAASTLVVVAIDECIVQTFHVGDSSCLVVGQRGKCKFQTVDHSPTGYAQEAGLMEEAQALHDPERHMILNALGTSEMRIDIGPKLELGRHDRLVLGSDGLFDNCTTAVITDHVRSGDIDHKAPALAQLCQERMHSTNPQHPAKPDDMTFIMYQRTR